MELGLKSINVLAISLTLRMKDQKENQNVAK